MPQERRREGRGIEVGHIFYFGRKYSEPMGLSVAGPDGAPVVPEMGSYGIGVSRLVGAVIEASHDEAGIIWPDSIAPFRAGILNLKQGDAATGALCERLYAALGASALYDDREERAGVKFADADLMGHPWQLVVGPRGAANGRVELKRRAGGERVELSVEDALAKVAGPRRCSARSSAPSPGATCAPAGRAVRLRHRAGSAWWLRPRRRRADHRHVRHGRASRRTCWAASSASTAISACSRWRADRPTTRPTRQGSAPCPG